MSALNPTTTSQESARRESQAEIRLVTWDDFFPGHAGAPGKLPPLPGAMPLSPPATPEVAKRSHARAALERVVEADSSPENDLPRRPKTADTEPKQRLGLQQAPRISRRSASAKRR